MDFSQLRRRLCHRRIEPPYISLLTRLSVKSEVNWWFRLPRWTSTGIDNVSNLVPLIKTKNHLEFRYDRYDWIIWLNRDGILMTTFHRVSHIVAKAVKSVFNNKTYNTSGFSNNKSWLYVLRVSQQLVICRVPLAKTDLLV